MMFSDSTHPCNFFFILGYAYNVTEVTTRDGQNNHLFLQCNILILKSGYSVLNIPYLYWRVDIVCLIYHTYTEEWI